MERAIQALLDIAAEVLETARRLMAESEIRGEVQARKSG